MRTSTTQPFCPVCQQHIRQILRFYAPRKKDPMDYTVIAPSRTLEARTTSGSAAGNLDDFVVDNLVVFSKTS
jgi:hypothetical protein